MKYLFLLLIATAYGYYPTVDGQRVEYGSQAEIPYWMGISQPELEICRVYIFSDQFNFDQTVVGSLDKIAYIDQECQIMFYQDRKYLGKIESIPEPATILLLLFGIRRKK